MGDLIGADLNGAILSWANLKGANLSGADLTKANMKNANLDGINLQGANLHGANLSGTNLREASITERQHNSQQENFSSIFGGTSIIFEFRDGVYEFMAFNHTKFCQTIMPDGTVNNRDCPRNPPPPAPSETPPAPN